MLTEGVRFLRRLFLFWFEVSRESPSLCVGPSPKCGCAELPRMCGRDCHGVTCLQKSCSDHYLWPQRPAVLGATTGNRWAEEITNLMLRYASAFVCKCVYIGIVQRGHYSKRGHTGPGGLGSPHPPELHRELGLAAFDQGELLLPGRLCWAAHGSSGWMDKWMDGWMDRWIDGWTYGWIDGWMDR